MVFERGLGLGSPAHTRENEHAMAAPTNALADRKWYIVERWQEYWAERRANLLRIVGIGLFYLIHLLHHYQLRLGFLELGNGEKASPQFHIAVTLLAVAWAMVALGVSLCLRQRVFPAALKYITTACDLLLLTAIIYLGNGPGSPLVVGYFLVLKLAALRLSLPLVRMATVGSVAGYLFLLGVARWPEVFGRGAIDLRVPRYEQLIVLLALVLSGIVLGQIVRRVRQLAEAYSAQLGTVERPAA